MFRVYTDSPLRKPEQVSQNSLPHTQTSKIRAREHGRRGTGAPECYPRKYTLVQLFWKAIWQEPVKLKNVHTPNSISISLA